MSTPITVLCPAKLNLYLDIGERRPDGFHEVSTLIQAIDLYDEVRLENQPGKRISLECDRRGLPAGPGNLCWRAAELIRRVAQFEGGVHISLRKVIPVAAGLGGGSSDAAGVLIGLNRLWKLGLPVDRLKELAGFLGSDVPFFIEAGTGFCTGRGEKVITIRNAPSLPYILLTPPLSVPTASVYELIVPGRGAAPVGTSAFLRILSSADAAAVAAGLYNRLEANGGAHMREVERLKSLLVDNGALGACMSGSGPSVFGIAENLTQARRILEEVREEAGGGTFACCGMTNAGHDLR